MDKVVADEYYEKLWMERVNKESQDSVLEEVVKNHYLQLQNHYQRQQQQAERNNPPSYIHPFTYQERLQRERRDIFRVTPFATMQKFPRQGNEELYGWTLRNKDGTVPPPG